MFFILLVFSPMLYLREYDPHPAPPGLPGGPGELGRELPAQSTSRVVEHDQEPGVCRHRLSEGGGVQCDDEGWVVCEGVLDGRPGTGSRRCLRGLEHAVGLVLTESEKKIVLNMLI